MGFFIGWKYFEDKEYYSFEAQAERRRVADEKRQRQLSEEKKARRRAEKKKIEKRKLREQWTAESSEYQKANFGIEGYADDSNYINSDVDAYKEEIARRYGTLYHSSSEKAAPSLDRGLGSAPSMKVKRPQNVQRDGGINPLGRLKSKRPVGMDPIGMETNKAVKESNQDASANSALSTTIRRPF